MTAKSEPYAGSRGQATDMLTFGDKFTLLPPSTVLVAIRRDCRDCRLKTTLALLPSTDLAIGRPRGLEVRFGAPIVAKVGKIIDHRSIVDESRPGLKIGVAYKNILITGDQLVGLKQG